MYRDGAWLRPTWKGAVRMPDRLLFPWEHITRLRNAVVRRRLVARAGLA